MSVWIPTEPTNKDFKTSKTGITLLHPRYVKDYICLNCVNVTFYRIDISILKADISIYETAKTVTQIFIVTVLYYRI